MDYAEREHFRASEAWSMENGKLKIENLPSPKLGEGAQRAGEVCKRAERESCSPKVGELSQSD